MRILFVENKHVTRTWEALASRLIAVGDDVHWMVQNAMWTPRIGAVHHLPLPQAGDLAPATGDRFAKVRDRDRGINYFGGGDRHYAHYARHIAAVIAEVRPDAIIGEATLFHELLAIDAARDAGVPYLFPTSVRYPSDRIGFLVGDTQEPVCGSGDVLAPDEIDRLIALYAERKSVPLFYAGLGKSGLSIMLTRQAKALAKNLTASLSRLRGERFNTPSIRHKLALERRQKALVAEWDAIAEAKRDVAGRTTVLFPLQMLPESTLETWGYAYRNQQRVLEDLVEASDTDTIFQVKTNPVPRYEVTRRLVDFVRTHPRVRPLPSSMKMDEVFWQADLIATVTGTVAIEGLLTGRPFVTMVYSLATPFAPARTLIEPREIGGVVDRIRAGAWAIGEEADRRAFLAHQVAGSHQAVVADYHHFPAVLAPQNLKRLADAFAHLRRAVVDGRLAEQVAVAEQRAAAWQHPNRAE